LTEEPQTQADEELDEDDEEDDDDSILDVRDLAPKRRRIRTTAGALIELYSPLELSLAKRAKVDRLEAQYTSLQKKKRLSNDQVTELGTVIDKLASEAIADLEEVDFEELTVVDKEAAIAVFTTAFGVMVAKLARGTLKTIGLTPPPDEDEEDDELDEIPES
jgi:hypothetical protein